MSAGKKFRFPWKRTLLVALLLFGAITAWRWTAPFVSTIAPLRQLPWEQPEVDELLVRAEGAPGAGLLLAGLDFIEEMAWSRKKESEDLADIVQNPRIYRYRSGADHLELATLEDWQRVESRICDSTSCWPSGRGVTGAWVGHDIVNHKLHKGGTVIQTAGQTVLRTTQSPRGDLVAVLSVTGLYEKHMISILNPPTASGKRFHELFRNPSGVRLGKPITLLGATESDAVIPVWSADQRFVIYHEGRFSQLWIIPVDAVDE